MTVRAIYGRFEDSRCRLAIVTGVLTAPTAGALLCRISAIQLVVFDLLAQFVIVRFEPAVIVIRIVLGEFIADLGTAILNITCVKTLLRLDLISVTSSWMINVSEFVSKTGLRSRTPLTRSALSRTNRSRDRTWMPYPVFSYKEHVRIRA